jgi:hypothetical protein
VVSERAGQLFALLPVPPKAPVMGGLRLGEGVSFSLSARAHLRGDESIGCSLLTA